MKLNASMLVVAMMVGSVAAMGCSKPSDSSSDAVAPEQSAAEAPVVDDANATDPGVEKDGVRVRFYAPIAPPSIRVEERGAAPSARHFWAPGYYRWNGREHVWYGGRWELRREGYEYMGPRWVNSGRRWEYRPHYWMRRR